MSPISPDDLYRIFKNLDKNNKGQVSINDLHHLLIKIGNQTTLEELEKLVGRTSLDYIDFLSFYEAMVNVKMSEQVEDHGDVLLDAFKIFDLNGDGFISYDELESVLSRLGLLEKRSGEDCKDMICVYDKNSDGVLDFEEFKNMMSVTTTPACDSET